MQQTKTGMVLAAAGALALGLTGCSGNDPRSQFMSACVADMADEAGCGCMADRLERNLDDDQFGKLADLMAVEEGDINEAEAAEVLGDGPMEELMIAAKQCQGGF
ncbi:MAG: hypothetical protein ACQER6_02330 [Pseudomonadota bacterium]